MGGEQSTSQLCEAIIANFAQWADTQDDIRFAFIIGSRARTDRPADEWSDLDLVFITTKPEAYITQSEWLSNFGAPRLTFLEGTSIGGLMERRVLYEGGLDVDFVPLPAAAVAQGFPVEFAGVFARGYRVIVDKDGMNQSIPAMDWQPPQSESPSEAAFLQHVNDFLYHAVWVAKKLLRGELWIAKMCSDGMMKRQLLQVLEWHTQICRPEAHEGWHDGRFLDVWADPRAVKSLRHAFAHYDAADMQRALTVTVELFGWLTSEIAQRLGYTDTTASTDYILELLESY